MKINNGLGVFAPTRVRRRKGTSRRPPWYVEVPPDTVDIALLPRINRYERGGLRFRRFGSTQQKFNDRLALFRDAMGEIEPGIGFTEEQMKTGLEEVMRERMRLIEEAEQRSTQKYGEVSTIAKDDVQQETTQREEAPVVKASISSQPLAGATVNTQNLSNEPDLPQDSSATESRTLEPLVGVPTDWLTRRLRALDNEVS